MQNIVSYFIERKAKDYDSNKDYKNVSSKAFGLFRYGHIKKIELAFDNEKVNFKCDCLPEMKKDSKHHTKRKFPPKYIKINSEQMNHC